MRAWFWKGVRFKLLKEGIPLPSALLCFTFITEATIQADTHKSHRKDRLRDIGKRKENDK